MNRFVAAIAAVPFVLGISATAHAVEAARAEPKVQTLETTKGLSRAGALRATHRRQVRLDPPAAQKGTEVPLRGAPLSIGFGRDVSALADESTTGSALEWQPLA